jgi:hypothetical protein
MSGQASSTEASADSVGVALGDGLAESVGSALALPEGEGLGELDGLVEALGELDALVDALGDADSAGLADGAADSDGVGAADVVTSGFTAGDEFDDEASLGAADAISPVRPLSATSNALLAMALGSDDAEALSLDVALADGVADAEGDSDSEAETDGEALPDDDDADGDADADADADSGALGEIVDDGDAVADGDALAIGNTMQGSCGALICSVAGAEVSEAIATEPVPKVAKTRLAETVIATPPDTRKPRLRAWLRNAERRERADIQEPLTKRE